MIVLCHPSADADTVREALVRLGLVPVEEVSFAGRRAFVLEPDAGAPPAESIARIAGVERVVPLVDRARLVSVGPARCVEVGPARFGAGFVSVIAGPCTVENAHALLRTARLVRDAGAAALRGGAFKVRTSPYSFQGDGADAVAALRHASHDVGLPFFTELTDPRQVEAVADMLDGIQIGARNMQNTPLLVEAARTGKPLLLKRHPGADVDEWLLAAEYCLDAGNENVILCERGIRAPGRHVRYLLDVGVVPYLKQRIGLPVIVDPSHAAGHHALVPALARSAIAAGADGLIVEVHPEPEATRCDAMQALPPTELAALIEDLETIVSCDGRRLVRPAFAEDADAAERYAAGS